MGGTLSVVCFSRAYIGNSGIFYHASEAFPVIYATAPEYQLIDAEGFPEKLEDWQQTGADYAMYPAPNAKPQPAGEWNSSGIKFNKNKVEYWLNNIKIVSFERYTYEWYQRRDSGKWKDYPTYGTLNEGYIGLQDHGSRVWFRNIKIKEL